LQISGLVGAGRIEIEANDDGEIRALWTHERTLGAALGRFDRV
jgi:hypothetical protein